MKIAIALLLLVFSTTSYGKTYVMIVAHPDDPIVMAPIMVPTCQINTCYLVSVTDGAAIIDYSLIAPNTRRFAKFMHSIYIPLRLRGFRHSDDPGVILASWDKTVAARTRHKSLSAYLKWGLAVIGATEVVIIDPVEAAGGHATHTAIGNAVLSTRFHGPIWSVTSRRIWDDKQIGLCPSGDPDESTYMYGWEHVVTGVEIFNSLFDEVDVLKVSPRAYHKDIGWLGNDPDCMTVNYKRGNR